MSAVNQGQVIKLPGHVAAADLRTHQFKLVKITAARTVGLCTATTDKPIGVLQNKPNTGEAAEVLVIGVTEVVAGETIAAGDKLTVNAVAKAVNDVPGAAPLMWFGTVIDGSAVDELATALINCAF